MANKKYLDDNGLLYFWQKIKTYIANAVKVTGVKGDSESTYRTGNVNITKSNIGLGNVGNFKAVSTVASQGLTDTEKSNARTNIGAGTGNGTITGVSMNGTSVATSGVANITSLPASILNGAIKNGVTATTQTAGDNSTKVATTAFVKTAVDNAIGSITQIEYRIVQTLPSTGEAGVIYLVPHSHGTQDIYDEYIWITSTSTFEKIGSTDIDLSDYVTETELSTALANYLLKSGGTMTGNLTFNSNSWISKVGNGIKVETSEEVQGSSARLILKVKNNNTEDSSNYNSYTNYLFGSDGSIIKKEYNASGTLITTDNALWDTDLVAITNAEIDTIMAS